MTKEEYKKLIYEVVESINNLVILKRIYLFIHSITG